jgi:KipI family sensor histidine kinase inhibitor
MGGSPTGEVTAHWLGDTALMLRFGERVDGALNARTHAHARRLADAALPGVLDIVPAYASVTLVLDPRVALDEDTFLAQALDVLEAPAPSTPPAGRLLLVPASYGGDAGPDLADVARYANLTPDDVVLRHTAVDYLVGMLGFQPGFPYLIGLDPVLEMPRRSTPRTRVAAGSIGIGGAQTGIYPLVSPGGWQLIGRVAAPLFDPRADPPTLFRPGDRVRFVAVPAAELAATRIEVRRA